jgi:hypothetical protein
MSLQQLKTNAHEKVLIHQEVNLSDVDIMIKNQEIEIVNLFCYLGCIISRNQRVEKEIESRLMKATSALNILRNIIWYRKVVSIDAKLRIFRACVLLVLLYGSEVWSLKMAQKKSNHLILHEISKNSAWLKFSRSRVSNHRILKLSGQPSIEDIMMFVNLFWCVYVPFLLSMLHPTLIGILDISIYHPRRTSCKQDLG